MGIISNDSIKISGISEEFELRDLNIMVKPNEHGCARLSIRVKNDGKPENIIKNVEDKLITIKSSEDGNSGTLFKGYIAKCCINSRESSGVVNIELVSASIKLEEEVESESYQKIEDTYENVVKGAIKKASGVNSYYEAKYALITIDKPIIRYKETAWEFIKRIASS